MSPREDSVKTKIFEDGTVTYWSAYGMCWIRHATEVPERELALMSEDLRLQIKEALARRKQEQDAAPE